MPHRKLHDQDNIIEKPVDSPNCNICNHTARMEMSGYRTALSSARRISYYTPELPNSVARCRFPRMPPRTPRTLVKVHRRITAVVGAIPKDHHHLPSRVLCATWQIRFTNCQPLLQNQILAAAHVHVNLLILKTRLASVSKSCKRSQLYI